LTILIPTLWKEQIRIDNTLESPIDYT